MPFLRDLTRYGLSTAIHNLRFKVGYRIGGFTSASKESTCD